MPETSRAKFIVELDTAQAERDLARLRGGGGSSDGGPGGGPTGGGRTGGGTGGGQSGPSGRRGAGGSGGRNDSAGGGMTLGKAAGIGAALVGLRASIREVANVVTAFTDAVNRKVLRSSGMSEGAFANVRAAQSASATTVDQLGIAGANATRGQIDRLYQMNKRIQLMREISRIRVQAISDPDIMDHSAPFFVAAGAVTAAKVATGAKMPGMLHR